jgi:hypothetical protein
VKGEENEAGFEDAVREIATAPKGEKGEKGEKGDS